MNKRPKTSFELTEITKPILEELKKGRWDYTEVLNAGIVVFSQLDENQKRFFSNTAYGLKSGHSENARDIFRDWILQLAADAESQSPNAQDDNKEDEERKPELA